MPDFVPTPHPVLILPTQEQALALGAEKLKDLLKKREELIRLERVDPFRHGFEIPSWKRADAQFAAGYKELVVLGGNRAAKSDYAGKRCMELLVRKRGARVWCFHETESTSIAMQHPYVYKYLPAEWKSLKKGVVTNINYSQKGGFTENTFVCPNTSQCWFRNYAQGIGTLEGEELDMIWCDELVPLNFLQTLLFRLATRGGILLVTFTPIKGWNPTVKHYLSGAKTLESTPAELLGGEPVPLVQQCMRPAARIVYFHTSENPYGGYGNLRKTLEGAPKKEILCRAYGVPTRAIANQFPAFNDQVHVIRQDLVPEKGTRYQIVDPCGGRNWFCIWVLVDVRGWYFVYREWPTPGGYIEGVGFPGPWAEPDGEKADGVRGLAQRPFGFGIRRYKEEFHKLEKDEQIEERYMDSRYGNSKTVAREAVTTLIEECAEEGLEFYPTPGDEIKDGQELITNLLSYDPEQPISALNSPRLYVTEGCENLIYSLHEWTGKDGKHGACKDPIDVLRYAAMLSLEHREGGAMLRKPRGLC